MGTVAFIGQRAGGAGGGGVARRACSDTLGVALRRRRRKRAGGERQIRVHVYNRASVSQHHSTCLPELVYMADCRPARSMLQGRDASRSETQPRPSPIPRPGQSGLRQTSSQFGQRNLYLERTVLPLCHTASLRKSLHAQTTHATSCTT